ncbi:DUF6838 family protein [Enterococcus cecorum]|uniref:phage tail terminator family protein n=1 Tax=Enterococcus cecorum TaxID=44008 RepID=UPI000643436B|nr:hypothetical protein [Enterococcus cecorum]KLO70152.1 hypothetical protein AA988_07555 [Enterococcus cecorum]CAI3371280.1 hypothetical protein CIRMBP1316_00669 [Enterococcus cecorum]
MDIMAAIGKALKQAVPDIKKIYREKTEQGFVGHSFYVYPIFERAAAEISNYEMRRLSYCVVYFPDESKRNVNEQLDTMRAQLMASFTHLPEVNLRLLEREATPVDGALNFTFSVRYRGLYTQDETSMATLTQKGGVAENGN